MTEEKEWTIEGNITVNGDLHVHPLNDLRDHDLDGTGCECGPEVEVIGANVLIVHNSWDRREIVEEAVRIMNGEEDDDVEV